MKWILALIAIGTLSADDVRPQNPPRTPVDHYTRTGLRAFGSGRSDIADEFMALSRSNRLAAVRKGAAAIEATVQARSARSEAGTDNRVIAFLKQRIADGSAEAAADLGNRYEKGTGVAQDRVEALRLYRLAVERGVSRSTNDVSRLLALVSTNSAPISVAR
jgi:TPR repeat protein